MEPLKKFKGQRPEDKVATKIDAFLRARGWHVIPMVGNAYLAGFPDRFTTHKCHGVRLIEYKYAGKFEFTDAQWIEFPKFLDNGCGIWVMVDATEAEYKKLWDPPNVGKYMGHHKMPPSQKR